MHTKLQEKLIDLFTIVIEHKITHPDMELIEDICDSYTEEVLQYLQNNHIGSYVKGQKNPWNISISEAKNAIKKLL